MILLHITQSAVNTFDLLEAASFHRPVTSFLISSSFQSTRLRILQWRSSFCDLSGLLVPHTPQRDPKGDRLVSF